MLAMDCAVRRTIPDNELLDVDQALRVQEAIQLYTGNAARVMGCGSEQGAIEQGKRADLAILSGDPFEKAFVEIRVVETLVGGETVWKRKRLDSPLKGDEAMEG
jgi:predicted amidohydrolase YtcJ